MLSEAKTDADVAIHTNLLNAVTVANKQFDAKAVAAVSPVGMLYLERLEMTPNGITRGALIATIPLAPGETTSVYQKEWSVTSSEFTSIVTDSLENYSATGVTENTELAQSTASQLTHSNQYNVSASASGGCGFVSGTVAASMSVAEAATASETQSRKDAVATTKTASSRVKQEHKVSISTTTATGTEESSTRTISNPSGNAIRIDYFSLICEWRVRLYRYGLRMTYDVTVPEPGATLRKAYARLDELNKTATRAFRFSVSQSDITEKTYLSLAEKYGTMVEPPPLPETTIQTVAMPNIKIPRVMNFAVKAGYRMTDLKLNAFLICENFQVIGTDLHRHESGQMGGISTKYIGELQNIDLTASVLGATNEQTLEVQWDGALSALPEPDFSILASRRRWGQRRRRMRSGRQLCGRRCTRRQKPATTRRCRRPRQRSRR